MKKETEFLIGLELNPSTAEKIVSALEFAIELRSGKFTWQHLNGCTKFISPRFLGIVNVRLCQAVLNGYRIGLFN